MPSATRPTWWRRSSAARDLHDLVVIGHSMGGGVTLMTYLKVAGGRPGPDQETGAHRQRRLPPEDALVHLARQGARTRFGGQPSWSRPGSPPPMVLRKCYYHKDRITEEQIDTYAYYGSLPGAREAVVATAQQIVPADIEASPPNIRPSACRS